MVIPAMVASRTCSYAPSNRDTSVDVPPMSNPTTGGPPSVCAVRAYPTYPPAGPDRMARKPEKSSACASPPSDCMKESWT